MNDQLREARWLVHERGVSVIALDHPAATRETDPKRIGKVPVIKWEPFQHAPPSDDNLTVWFGQQAPRNLAIVTGAGSNLVAVDGDSEKALALMHARLPATEMRTRTARGEHWFYRHPGVPIPNQARIRIEGSTLELDVRGDGGYVVAPTSTHVSGVIYERMGRWPPIAELPVFDPAWLTKLGSHRDPSSEPPRATRARAPGRGPTDHDQVLRRARRYIASVPPAIEGQGGDAHTFQLACKLVRGFGLSDAEAFDLLRDWNAGCVPPWTDRALEDKIRGAHKYGREPVGGRADTPPPAGAPRPGARDDLHPFALTDTGNGQAFAAWYGTEWRRDYQRGVWRHWEPPIWAADADGHIFRTAKDAMRRRYREAGHILDLEERARAARWAISSESRARLEACVFLAASERPIADTGATWDADPYLLACANDRVVDLRTGDWHAGRQEDRLTLQTAAPYEPAAHCPRFEQFMAEVTGRDQDLAHYLQKCLGYSMSGDIGEQCLWFLFGPGSGGKTTLLRTIAKVLGSYSYTAPFSTFLKDPHGSSVSNDLAILQGKRFVPASEVRERARLDEGRIKSLTGGDDVTARFLHQEFFTFRPRVHLWLAVNHKPVVTDDSVGFWRRVRLVPFTQRFPLTPGLEAELEAEAPGILAWLVRGCLLWQAEGLAPPPAVRAATDDYEQDSDPLVEFLTAMCKLDAAAALPAGEFYRLYATWADDAGITGRERLSATAFGRLMPERFRKDTASDGTRLYLGVRRRQLDDPPDKPRRSTTVPEGLDQ